MPTSRLDELLPPALVRQLHGCVLGERPSLADAAVWGELYMLELSVPGWIAARMPALRDWWERMRTARA